MRTVVHVCQRDDPGTGGAVRVAFELVRRLPTHGYDARLLFLYGDEGPFGRQLPTRCDYLRIRSSAHLTGMIRLRRYLAGIGPAIVHHHDDLLWPQLVLMGMRSWTAVLHAHNGGVRRPRPFRIWLLNALQLLQMEFAICITGDAQSGQVENSGWCRERTRVVPNGVDASVFSRGNQDDRRAAREKLGIPHDCPVVGFVGRLHNAMKGGDDFIRVVARLPENWWGIVVGDGPDREALAELAAELGIRQRVRFAGMVVDTVFAYRAMDVFCFTSRFEPFGLTIAEAMSCEVPVVGFRCPGGSGDILTDSTGVTINVRDVDRLACEVVSAARAEGVWESRVKAARKLIEERFDWNASALAISRVYDQLCTRGSTVHH